ncbi:hypothetical protein MRX96_028159 [Rhipicephalus microplus]
MEATLAAVTQRHGLSGAPRHSSHSLHPASPKTLINAACTEMQRKPGGGPQSALYRHSGLPTCDVYYEQRVKPVISQVLRVERAERVHNLFARWRPC